MKILSASRQFVGDNRRRFLSMALCRRLGCLLSFALISAKYIIRACCPWPRRLASASGFACRRSRNCGNPNTVSVQSPLICVARCAVCSRALEGACGTFLNASSRSSIRSKPFTHKRPAPRSCKGLNRYQICDRQGDIVLIPRRASSARRIGAAGSIARRCGVSNTRVVNNMFFTSCWPMYYFN